MRVTMNKNNPIYKANPSQENKSKSGLLAVATGAMLTPLVPLIDGDSFKKTYKDRNIAKYATGLMAVGGGIVATNVLADKYISNSKNKEQNNLIKKSIIGALAVTSLYLTEHWANTKNSTMNKKYLFLSSVLGAIVGALTGVFNHKKD